MVNDDDKNDDDDVADDYMIVQLYTHHTSCNIRNILLLNMNIEHHELVLIIPNYDSEESAFVRFVRSVNFQP